MANNEFLSSFSKEELIRLIGAYSRNWLAMDGAWFQAAERDYGMDAAMELDRAAWRVFTVAEARRIKSFLKLPEQAGLAVAEREGDVLTLYALLSDRSPEWAAGCFAGVRVLRLGYTPADAAGFACETYQEEDTTLFYRGRAVEALLSHGTMFPTLSHA